MMKKILFLLSLFALPFYALAVDPFVFQPSQGGTGTGTPAVLGDVLYWNGSNWQGRATSTLGISGTNYFADLLDVTLTSTSTGDTLYIDSVGDVVNLSSCSDGEVMKWSSGIPSCGADNTGAGGSGAFSTSTTQVSGQDIVYPNGATDVLAVGDSSTTTAEVWFDPSALVNYFKGKVGVGTTSPYAPLSVVGETVSEYFTATSTTQTSSFLKATSSELTLGGFPFTGDEIVQGLGTGVLDGGTLTKVDDTTFSIAAGSGIIVDSHTDPLNPTMTKVTWSASSTVHALNISTQDFTAVAVDENGDIQQFEFFDFRTNGTWRDHIMIGALGHVAGTILESVDTIQVPVTNINHGLADLSIAIGTINQEGNVYRNNGNDLTISKTAGKSYRFGFNRDTDPQDPNFTVDAVEDPVSEFLFQYRDGAGDFTTGTTTTIDVGNYDDGDGTLGTVSTNKWQIFRIYHFPDSAGTLVTYGQNLYNSQSEAQSEALSESFVASDIVNSGEGVLRAFLITRGGATDLSDTGDALFIEVTKFGGLGGGSTLSTANLQDVYENSTVPQILIDALGAFTIQGDTGTDTDSNYETQNNAGVTTGKWQADGLLETEYFTATGTQDSVFPNFTSTNGTTTNATSTNLAVTGAFDFLGTIFTDLTSFLFETELDTETELEGQLTDVTDVFTNNDGALADDDITDDSIESLNDVASMTQSNNDVLYWNGSAWTNTATTSWDTDTQLSQEQVEDFSGAMVSGNTETLITVTYQDGDGTMDYVVDNDLANYSNTNSAFITLSSLSASYPLSYDSGTGAFSYVGLATTSNPTAGMIFYSDGTNGLIPIATSSVNVGTATALQANGSNCSAGSAAGGVDASGVAEDCTAYAEDTRQLTVAGTANQITSSAGAQDLSADRTWTLSLPSHVIFPGDYQATNATTTNATTTNQDISGLLTFDGVTGSTWSDFCVSITGGSGLCDGSDDGAGGSDPYVNWTATSHFGTTTSATSTPLFLRGNQFALFASSTSVFTNSTTTLAEIGTLITGGDTINEFAGTGLTVTGNALTADLGTDIAASEIADGDHGDFTYASGVATLDASVVSDNEIDYGTVTLNDFTNDAGFLTTVDISDDTNLAVSWPITLTGDSVGFDGLSTSSAAVIGNIPYFSGVNTFANVATTSPTIGTGLTYSGTFGDLIGGAAGTLTVDLGTDIAASEIADGDHGDFTYSSGVASIDADAVTLTTDTTGNYVASVTNGTGISGGDGGSEGAALTLAIDGSAAISWTGLQTISNATTTNLDVLNQAAFGSTATSTFDSAGVLTLVGNLVFQGTTFTAVSGADTTLITGTAGASGNCAEWNADGDLVDSGGTCGGGGGVDGFDFDYSQDNGYGVTGSATSTNVKFSAGIHASSTSHLANATTTLGTVETLWVTTLDTITTLGATAESTIESAIDTLANLTSIQGLTVTLADAGANAFFGWDDAAGAYENLTAAEALTIIGGQANDFDSNGDVTIAASDITSGTLVHERGGLEADVSAFDGAVFITGGATSATTTALAWDKTVSSASTTPWDASSIYGSGATSTLLASTYKAVDVTHASGHIRTGTSLDCAVADGNATSTFTLTTTEQTFDITDITIGGSYYIACGEGVGDPDDATFNLFGTYAY